jgi:hypothetical protein
MITEYFCRECEKMVKSNPPIPAGFWGEPMCSKGFTLEAYDNPYAEKDLQIKLSQIKEKVRIARMEGTEYHCVDIYPETDSIKSIACDFFNKSNVDGINKPSICDSQPSTDYTSSTPRVSPRFYCSITINGVQTTALVDTGLLALPLV